MIAMYRSNFYHAYGKGCSTGSVFFLAELQQSIQKTVRRKKPLMVVVIESLVTLILNVLDLCSDTVFSSAFSCFVGKAFGHNQIY